MALPKIELPLFEMTLPMTGEKIKYRPFTVREEKILLLAQESNDIDQVILSVKQVINNCIHEKDVEKMSMLDVEYLMVVLRSRSIDNNVEFFITDPETFEKVKLSLNLDNVKIIKNENHSDMIRLNEDYVLKMRYPTLNEFSSLIKSGVDNNENNYKIMLACMDQLLSKDEVYKFEDFNEKEKDEFALNLSGDILMKIKNFFDTIPQMRHEIKYKNKNNNEKTFVIEGLKSFFL
jgi:hypothetical protein